MRFVGPRAPVAKDTLPPWVPEQVRALFETWGEGLLAGQIRLVAPGSHRHIEVNERFQARLGWGWLASEGVTTHVLGEAEGNRGFLLHVSGLRDSASLWFAHLWGGVHPVGHDLGDVESALVAGMIVVIERHAAGLHDRIEDLGETFDIADVYDTREDDVGAALQAAFATGDESAIDAAFATFMERGLPVDRVAAAESLSGPAGAAADGVRDTIRIIRKRNSELAKLESLRASQTALGDAQRAVVELRVRAAPSSAIDMLRVASALPRPAAFARIVGDALAGAKRHGVDDAIVAALTECNAEEVLAFATLLMSARAQPAREPWFTKVTWTPETDFVADEPWCWVGPYAEKVWPIAAMFLFGSVHDVDWAIVLRVIARVRDPRLVPVLDVFLARTDDKLWNGSGRLAAGLRTEIRPLADADIVWITGALARIGPIPPKYGDYQAEGLMALLARNATLDAAADLLVANATRNSYLVLDGARRRGNDAKSRALLASLWGKRQAHYVMVVYDACKLAVEWGDAAAKRALPLIEKAVERESRKIERM